MTHKLSVAMDIADAVAAADDANRPMDVEGKADELARQHSESGVSREHIAAALQDESDAAGLETG